jgi:hypothetical protein
MTNILSYSNNDIKIQNQLEIKKNIPKLVSNISGNLKNKKTPR